MSKDPMQLQILMPKQKRVKIHFRDTMRGGKMLNNWKMAQIHAENAPVRVRELEHWGAVFDRTKEGLLLFSIFFLFLMYQIVLGG